jgi:hypothetical protein
MDAQDIRFKAIFAFCQSNYKTGRISPAAQGNNTIFLKESVMYPGNVIGNRGQFAGLSG